MIYKNYFFVNLGNKSKFLYNLNDFLVCDTGLRYFKKIS